MEIQKSGSLKSAYGEYELIKTNGVQIGWYLGGQILLKLNNKKINDF